MVWFRRNVARLGLVVFLLMLSVLVAIPEEAFAIGCGGGLFGSGLLGRSRRQERRATRVEGRASRFGAVGCSGAAFGCAGQAQHTVWQAPAQAPAKHSVCPTCPANNAIEKDYPQAAVNKQEHFVSMEVVDVAWDRIPEGAKEFNIPQW